MNLWSLSIVIILTLGWCLPLPAAEPNPPIICIRKSSGPADMQNTSIITGFTDISTNRLAVGRTEAAIAFDEECLYITFKCFSPVPPKVTLKERDGNVWDDDAVEVVLDPSHSHTDYYQFIGSAGGATWDSRGRDSTWNAKWDYVAKIEKGYWIGTFKIPFASLGVKAPADGTIWGFNLCRDQQTPDREISSWAVVEGSFHAPDRFGHLLFDRKGAAIRIATMERTSNNEVRLTAEILAGQNPLEFSASVQGAQQTEKIEPGTTKKIEVNQKVTSLGIHKLLWEVKDMKLNKPVASVEATMQIVEPLSVSLRKYFLNGLLGVDVVAPGLQNISGLQARVEICKKGEKTPLLSGIISEFDQRRKGSVEMRVGDLPPGDYTVVVFALDSTSKQVAQASTDFALPKRPEWLGSKAGITTGVLPPWTPIQLDGKKVKCWGRVYDFSKSFLPSEVITADVSVLAAPIELWATVEGKTLQWANTSPRIVSATDARVDFEFVASADPFDLTGKAYVEYDGMIWVDLVVSPKRPVNLNSLTLEMPMKESCATLMHYFPGQWGKATNSGSIPEAGWSSVFKPFVWLGTEERGLAWFMETDELFVLKDKAKALEIVRERGEAAIKPDLVGSLLGKQPTNVVRLRVHLIDGPFELTEPRRYAFGFQATPVKPWPKDFHEWRICHGASYGMDKRHASRPVTVTYPADGNIELEQGTVEAWVTPTFDPNVKIENPSTRGMFNQSFFSVRFRNAEVGFYWNIDDRGMRFYAKVDDSYPLILGTHPQWKQGEPHHVAFSWGKELRIYLDGKLAVSKPLEGLLGGAKPRLTEGNITIGGGEFIIDELRISRIERTTFDLNAPPSADADALLVDHFDDPVPGRFGGQTKPAKIAGHLGGQLSRGGVWVPTKFGKGLVLGGKVESGVSALDLAQQLGVKTLIYHEHWTDIQNYRMVGHEEELKHLVAECHKRGIKLLVYFGYEISNIAPEWEIYARDVGRLNPDAPLPTKGGYHRTPEQYAFGVCYNSWWQDFLCDAIERTMKEYDLDGVYLDGTIEPMGCANYRHGCGYRRPEGGYAATYPILAVRNTMKRIYAICMAKPGSHVNAHQSTCCTTPTLAFTTSYWDGEQLGSVPHAENPLEVLPLDTFRAEFMGRNFGVPCELLNYAPKPYTLDEALSFSMLHDVLVRPSGVGAALEQMSEIWNVMSAFGVDDAEFLPYWRNSYLVQTSTPSIFATLYRRPDKGILMVISNLGQADDPAASVQLNLKELGLAGKALEAEDTLAQEKIDVKDGKVTTSLNRMRMKLVWVKTQEK